MITVPFTKPISQGIGGEAGGGAAYVFGNALDFDGVNDRIDLAATLTLAGDFTIIFWFNADAFGGMALSDDTVNDNYIWMQNNDDIQYNDGAAQIFDGLGPISTGEWHQVVITKSGTTGRLYLDAVEAADTKTFDNSIDFAIFAAYFDGTLPFNGKEDEIYIWDGTVATEPQVVSIYNGGGAAVNPEGVIGTASNVWRFDESSGTVLSALRGGNAGELTNFADPDSNWVAHE